MQVIVLGLEHQSYTSKAGKLIEKLICHYFDVHEIHTSKIERGYRLLNQDLFGNYTADDFKSLPGIYEVNIEPIPAPGGKIKSRFSEINFLNNWEIDSKNKGYLVLAAKRIEFESEDGSTIRGVKIFFINPRGYISDDEIEGYIPLQAFLTSKISLSHLPAFYNLDFDEVRGRNGEAMLKIIPTSVSLIASFGEQKQEAAG